MESRTIYNYKEADEALHSKNVEQDAAFDSLKTNLGLCLAELFKRTVFHADDSDLWYGRLLHALGMSLPVTVTGNGLAYSGLEYAIKGMKYTASVAAEEGYSITSVTVRMEDEETGETNNITSTAYNSTTHEIHIAEVTGPVYVDAVMVEPSNWYNITYTLTHVTSSESATTAGQGTVFRTNLTEETGYAMTAVTVTMGGTDVTSSVYTNGRVNIGNVSGDIVITATAEQIAYTVSTSLYKCTLSNSATGLADRTPYVTDITVESGYELYKAVVTMGGTDITATAYSANNQRISIAEVTGDLVITCKAQKPGAIDFSANLRGTSSMTNETTKTTINHLNGSGKMPRISPLPYNADLFAVPAGWTLHAYFTDETIRTSMINMIFSEGTGIFLLDQLDAEAAKYEIAGINILAQETVHSRTKNDQGQWGYWGVNDFTYTNETGDTVYYLFQIQDVESRYWINEEDPDTAGAEHVAGNFNIELSQPTNSAG